MGRGRVCGVSHLLAETEEWSKLTQALLCSKGWLPPPQTSSPTTDADPRDISEPELIRRKSDAIFTPVEINAVAFHVWDY